jgi:hypothetical protein
MKGRSRQGSRMHTLLLAAALGLLAAAQVLLGCAQEGGPSAAETGAASDIGASNPLARPERVVLVSVAGLRPEYYGVVAGQGLREAGALMPNLARLARNGAYAERMAPVMPAAPYPVHATFVTGLRPDRHQVLGDELLGPQGLHVRGISLENRIRGIPLWRAARAAGHSTTALNWPMTRGADVALLLPDMGVPGRSADETWLGLLGGEASPWVVDRLRRFDESLETLAWPTTQLRDELVERLACEIAHQPVTPALWLMAFERSGTALARDGPGTDGTRLGFKEVDTALGRLLECFDAAGLSETTAIVVVGDRALFPLHTIVYPNTVLEQVGLITSAPRHLNSGIATWDAFVRSFGGAAVVYAKEESDALLARRALDEYASRTRAFRIVPAAELAELHADPQVWFGVEADAGFGIGKSARGPVVQATDRRGLGGFLPSHEGSAVGFVAWGAGIRPGVRVPETAQIDVAPTVAELLGFHLRGTDGSPLVGILGTASQAGWESGP